MNKNENVVDQTKAWIKTVIVKHNICPFAGREVKRDSIRYSACEQTDFAQCLERLLDEFRILDVDNEVETSLVIYQNAFLQFEDYLDYVDVANSLISEECYEGIYQLASFHPDYCFAETDQNDPSNYTNRSPYPMLHIIREASLEKVLKEYPVPEMIPENNIELTRKLGLKKMQVMLQACYDKENDDETSV